MRFLVAVAGLATVMGLAVCQKTPDGASTADESSRTARSGGAPTKVAPATAVTASSDDEEAPEIPDTPVQEDVGIFSEFDEKVSVTFPSWLEDREVTVRVGPEKTTPVASVGGVAVGFAHRKMGEVEEVQAFEDDRDGDAIPDQLDILLGAKKTAINGAKYQGGYIGMEYPGGDVPRTEGVCTDVIVRAVRNAGLDIQKALHEDIKTNPAHYPMVETPDPNIDQRRVRTLLPYFEHNWTKLNTDPDDLSDWAPGDVVFLDTMDGPRPDHMGIVADRLGDSGYPLIINNWTNGHHTKQMDLLGFVPVTHRYRF